MPNSKIVDWEIKPDESGTFLVHCKNKKKLLFDGLIETFGVYGNVAAIRNNGYSDLNIRFIEKDAALKCYYDLKNHPDFMANLPHKLQIKESTDPLLNTALDIETGIGFPNSEPSYSERQVIRPEEKNVNMVSSYHYVCKKRNIVNTQAFKEFVLSNNTSRAHLHSHHNNNTMKILLTDLMHRLRGTSLNFKTGFDNNVEKYVHRNEIHQLVLAENFFEFQNTVKLNAVDVLICNFPPKFQQIDAYKFLLPLVPDDLLQIDWYRIQLSDLDDYTLPYCIVYLKTHHAACTLRYCANNVVLNNNKVSVFLIENVEEILLDVKKKLLKE